MFTTFVLTVEQPDGLRRRHLAEECERLGLACHCVQGVTFGDREISETYSVLSNLFYSKRSMTQGEIACYIGHRRTWQAFLDSGAEVALICEDDFKSINDADFREVLDRAVSRDDWDILKLFDFAPKKILHSVPLGSLSIVDYKYPAAGAVCYLIRRKAALRLLRRKKIFRPVDEDFLYCWEFGLRVRSVYPNPVAEVAADLGGSVLEAERVSIKRNRNRIRSLWGMFLAGYKQIRSKAYRASLRRGADNS
ncbi:glycosyltransferase family 25 protein [Celeribacter sp.]|uniref:glycosyltransferase family 25 protein n=1 Tax=Celeribacter sp. TaxID=1890673 RepID=UPI003A93CAC5